MTIQRREFLQIAARDALAAGAFLQFGKFRNIYIQDSRPAGASAFDAALAASKREGRPCVAFVLPSDLNERVAIGDKLVEYLYGVHSGEGGSLKLDKAPNFEIHALFTEAIFIFLSRKEAGSRIGGFVESESAVLLRDDGARAAGAPLPTLKFIDPAQFIQIVGALLHGADLELLKKRAELCAKNAGAEWKNASDRFINYVESHPMDAKAVFAAWSRYVSDSSFAWQHREQAASDARERTALCGIWLKQGWPAIPAADYGILQKETRANIPSLVLLLQQKNISAERRNAILILIENDLFSYAEVAGEPAQPLPFGLHLETTKAKSSGCGDQYWGEDVFDCGMARASAMSRKLIRFL